jgi:hypothetical protein
MISRAVDSGLAGHILVDSWSSFWAPGSSFGAVTDYRCKLRTIFWSTGVAYLHFFLNKRTILTHDYLSSSEKAAKLLPNKAPF